MSSFRVILPCCPSVSSFRVVLPGFHPPLPLHFWRVHCGHSQCSFFCVLSLNPFLSYVALSCASSVSSVTFFSPGPVLRRCCQTSLPATYVDDDAGISSDTTRSTRFTHAVVKTEFIIRGLEYMRLNQRCHSPSPEECALCIHLSPSAFLILHRPRMKICFLGAVLFGSHRKLPVILPHVFSIRPTTTNWVLCKPSGCAACPSCT